MVDVYGFHVGKYTSPMDDISLVHWLVRFSTSTILTFFTGPCLERPEKKGPKRLFRLFTGSNTTQLYGDYFINHDIRIPIKTSNTLWKVRPGFFRGSNWSLWSNE